MKKITNEEFASSTVANKMVLIKLGAEWCGPCRTMHPILEAIDSENEDITVFDVDVDQEVELCSTLGIRSVPTMLFYKDGDLIDKITGSRSKEQVLNIFKD